MAKSESERGPRVPSKKPCRFFHQNDCFRGDKCHMVHAPKDSLAPCQTHRFWMEDPWVRPKCKWGEECTFPHPKAEGPEDPELLRTNIALQTENSQLARVRAYASEVLGKGGEASDTGIARSGTSRYRQKLALLEARNPEAFSRRCVSDSSLCRSLLRVYLLGGGVCTSLEEAGRMVSEAVVAGNYPGANLPAGADDADAATASASATGGTTPIPTLCVRVQALPKVMELQLIDEDTTFWDDNFPNLSRERQAGAFTHVLSVVFARGAFLWGLAEAATHGRSIIDNNNEDTAVCRAFYKIKEVSSRAELTFSKDWTAVDIGAAPGGWTSFLASKCRRVLSVDPAELDPAILALPNVVHVQQTIQAARDTLLALLAEEPPPPPSRATRSGQEKGGGGGDDGEGGVENGGGVGGEGGSPSPSVPLSTADGSPPESTASSGTDSGRVVVSPENPLAGKQGARRGGADLLVSDMNAEPTVVADVLLSAMAAGLARPGAVLVATFKDFCGRHKRMRDEVAAAVARLEAGTAADAGASAGGGGGGGSDASSGLPRVPEARAAGDAGGEGGDGDVSAVDAVGDGSSAADTAAVSPSSIAVEAPATSTPAGSRRCRDEGEEGGRSTLGSGLNPVEAAGGGGWRLEGVETMKLLAGGQTEVTITARVAYGDAAGVGDASVNGGDEPAA
ncbi:unnamed protein product [Scytosiphon promiscuus]